MWHLWGVLCAPGVPVFWRHFYSDLMFSEMASYQIKYSTQNQVDLLQSGSRWWVQDRMKDRRTTNNEILETIDCRSRPGLQGWKQLPKMKRLKHKDSLKQGTTNFCLLPQQMGVIYVGQWGGFWGNIYPNKVSGFEKIIIACFGTSVRNLTEMEVKAGGNGPLWVNIRRTGEVQIHFVRGYMALGNTLSTLQQTAVITVRTKSINRYETNILLKINFFAEHLLLDKTSRPESQRFLFISYFFHANRWYWQGVCQFNIPKGFLCLCISKPCLCCFCDCLHMTGCVC